jgi:competence ComEA-like helix-hairpin-helix protein
LSLSGFDLATAQKTDRLKACPTETRMLIRHRSAAVLLSTFVLLALCVAAQSKKMPPAKPIDLNLANAKELEELPGVGPVTSQRILDLRTKNGRFKRVEDLLAVRGISQKKLDAMRPFVMVAPQATTPKPSPAPPGQKSQDASPSNGHG